MDLRELAITGLGAGRHPWENARFRAVEFLLHRRARPLSDSSVVLDFGCGDAFLASALARSFPSCEVLAVDKAFNEAVRSQIETTLVGKIRLFDSLEKASEAGAKPASFVLLLDVLEHCEDAVGVLRGIVENTAVAPRAQFLLTVPAFGGLYSRYDAFLGHYRRYRVGELERVARAAGLKVVRSSYFFSSLVLPRALRVALEKLHLVSTTPKGLADYQSKPLLDALVQTALWLDFRLCEKLARWGIRLPGLSCFVLAEK